MYFILKKLYLLEFVYLDIKINVVIRCNSNLKILKIIFLLKLNYLFLKLKIVKLNYK